MGADKWKVYLVTNKHVLDIDPTVRVALNHVDLHINVTKAGKVVGDKVRLALKENGTVIWREHADPAVDVLAIPVTRLYASRTDLANKFAPEELFAPAAVRQALDISAGEEIVVVGYPSGIRQGLTNLPLVRQGIISTRIGEELHEEEPIVGGGVRIRKTRGFLIDGATIPGSSGSPVVLKPVIGRQQGNTIMMGSYESGTFGHRRRNKVRANQGHWRSHSRIRRARACVRGRNHNRDTRPLLAN